MSNNTVRIKVTITKCGEKLLLSHSWKVLNYQYSRNPLSFHSTILSVKPILYRGNIAEFIKGDSMLNQGVRYRC